MKCEDVLRQLEDYGYGELESVASEGIAEHLRACRGCSESYRALEREQGFYRAYSESVHNDVNPAPGMWQGIRAAITPVRPRRTLLDRFESLLPSSRFMRYAVFATAVACVSITGTLLAVRMFAPRPQISAERAPAVQNSLEAALYSVHRAELEYVQAIGLLNEIVEKQKQALEPAKRAELEKHLKLLDDEITRARQAFHSHPLDTELGIYMLTAYREKVELLQDLATS